MNNLKTVLTAIISLIYSSQLVAQTDNKEILDDSEQLHSAINYLLETVNFDPEKIEIKHGDVFIDYDIAVSLDSLMLEIERNKNPSKQRYNPYRQVDQNRVKDIKVAFKENVPEEWRTATRQAIQAYKWIRSAVNFRIVDPTEEREDITISYDHVSWNCITYATGFFPSNGYPGDEIVINDKISSSFWCGRNLTANQKIGVMVHEFGHTLGIEHTDSYRGFRVPVTPTSDPNSIFNSVFDDWSGFSLWDKLTISHLYPDN